MVRPDIFQAGKPVVQFGYNLKIFLISDGGNETFYHPLFIINYNCMIHNYRSFVWRSGV